MDSIDDLSHQSDASAEASDLISSLAFGDNPQAATPSPPLTTSSDSQVYQMTTSMLEPATIRYHESARSIVFRDQVRRLQHPTKRRAASSSSSLTSSLHSDRVESSTRFSSIKEEGDEQNNSILNQTDHSFTGSTTSSLDQHQSLYSHETYDHLHGTIRDDSSSLQDTPRVIIANFTPVIDPLPPLELEPHNEFQQLMQSNPYKWTEKQGPENADLNEDVWSNMTDAEKEVVEMLKEQKCLVKTVKNNDWKSFLQKFKVEHGKRAGRWLHPADLATATKKERITRFRENNDDSCIFNSFVTSCTLLPSCGLKMRCYGSSREYTCGIIFPLPRYIHGESEDKAVKENKVWCWPSGYSAKTEYNISEYGQLLNGREEALVTLNQLREMNHRYLYDKDYEIAGRMVKGGLNTLPYNEVYARVGGRGRFVNKIDVATGLPILSDRNIGFDGLGLPVALFVRSAMYGDLTALLRLRARLGSVLGKAFMKDIPLLFLSSESGVRVLTEKLEFNLLKTLSNSLNPFQNPQLSHHNVIGHMQDDHYQQKLEELLDLDSDNIRKILTVEECARLAGGFGATDDSVANLLMDAMVQDFEKDEVYTQKNLAAPQSEKSNKLQSIVNEGLAAAVRSNDFNTSRQLLILYSLVASRGQQEREREKQEWVQKSTANKKNYESTVEERRRKLSDQINTISNKGLYDTVVKDSSISALPAPPPLDTDRLRSATNSDGLLAVLGAAEVLKSIQTGEAKKRALEAAESIEEWVHKSENSVAYRLASWRDLTAAQDDLKIATESNSNFMAFISNKAINNRKRFAAELREAVEATNFEGIEFLRSINYILKEMHHPCLRLELLQFILGLDNRYSIAHVARSIELAATCLSVSTADEFFNTSG